jgi:ethanolamine transporter EutH
VFFVGVSIGADVVFICRRALECLAVTNKMHGLRLQLICLLVSVPVAAMLGLLLVVMERLEAMQRRVVVAVVVQVARSR